MIWANTSRYSVLDAGFEAEKEKLEDQNAPSAYILKFAVSGFN